MNVTTEKKQLLKALGIEYWHKPEVNVPADELAAPVTTQTPVDALSIEQLRERVAHCERCELHCSRTQTVFGVGALDADVMFVGEAPGQQEDLKGEPFVGPAGQLLDKMLASIELSRQTVFIANVLKCRPPFNRDPSAEEVALCTAYLDRQIGFIKPKLIVALGRIAAHYLLQTTTSLANLRGTVHTYHATGTPLLVTYHPAYLLRTPADKRKAYQDLLQIKSMITQDD